MELQTTRIALRQLSTRISNECCHKLCASVVQDLWSHNAESHRQALWLELTPASERPNKLAAGFGASRADAAHLLTDQAPDSPAYRSGVDIEFLRHHDLQLI